MTATAVRETPPPTQREIVRNRIFVRFVLATAVGIALLSVTRIASDQNGLTSAGAIGAAINLSIPIMLAALGGLWSERSGVVNIGLEGQMILGTWFGAYFAWQSHSAWMLIVGGIVGGVIGGILHAIATVGFGVDQIISGVALNLLAPGITKYLSGIIFTTEKATADGGGETQSPQVAQFHTLKWNGAHEQLAKLAGHHWFFISDLAGILDGIVTSLNVFTIIAILLIPASWFILWRTSFGLRLRSCGENPTAAETLGVKVYTMKATAVVISGSLAGLAGAFLVDFTGLYREGQTAGRGYIGLAAMIFGNWQPVGLGLGSSLFGYTDGLQQQQDNVTVHALLLLVAMVLGLYALWSLYKRSIVAGAVSGVVAALVFVWYLTTDAIPAEFATYSPYIITLLVLAVASQRLRMPAADGIPWRRGQGA